MFNLDFSGTTNDAATAVAAMVTSTGTAAETALLAAAKTLAAAAMSAAYLRGTNYSGNVQLLIRGGWEDGSTTLSLKLNNVELPASGQFRSGDPGTRLNSFAP